MMRLYLSKKIAVPNDTPLCCVAWHSSENYIACGGQNGVLKVLKLDNVDGGENKVAGIASPSNLTMNKSLEGHSGKVCCVRWNEGFKKLTTSDDNGLIIVWIFSKGVWTEEMINNRNKSIVRDMRWTGDGQDICIIYDDGAVIVGSSDGRRIWGKDVEGRLKFVEWFPDGKSIMFLTEGDQIIIYGYDGNLKTKFHLSQLYPPSSPELGTVTCIEWFRGIDLNSASLLLSSGLSSWSRGKDGSFDCSPMLAIGFSSGSILLMEDIDQKRQTLLTTTGSTFAISSLAWSPDGSVVAVVGTCGDKSSPADGIQLSLLNRMGKVISQITLEGKAVTCVCWDGNGLRLALAVDHYIYMVNCRPDYAWSSSSLSSSSSSLSLFACLYVRADRMDSQLLIWDTILQAQYNRSISRAILISAYEDLICVITSSSSSSSDGSDQAYIAWLYTSTGSLIDSKHIFFHARFMVMQAEVIVISSRRSVYLWTISEFKRGRGGSDDDRRMLAKERIFDIDSGSVNPAHDYNLTSVASDASDDPITGIDVSGKVILVLRSSGLLVVYSLPHVSQDLVINLREAKYKLNNSKTDDDDDEYGGVSGKVRRLAMNCDSTCCCIVNSAGFVSCHQLSSLSSSSSSSGGTHETTTKLDTLLQAISDKYHDRKEVWDVKWSSSNPDAVAIIEKSKLVVYYDGKEDSSQVSSGCVISYHGLSLRLVAIDHVYINPDSLSDDAVINVDVSLLKTCREILTSGGGIREAWEYARQLQHDDAYRLIATAALESLDLDIAKACYVCLGDYSSVKFIKRLESMADKLKQRAEVCLFFNKPDEAEEIYREIDRVDLSIAMRFKIGQWTRVLSLAGIGPETDVSGGDELVRQSMRNIGIECFRNRKYKKAVQYLSHVGEISLLSECLFRIRDYEALNQLCLACPEKSPVLKEIAGYFNSSGHCEYAVACFIKFGDEIEAMECCIRWQRWDLASKLSLQFDFPQLEKNIALEVTTLIRRGLRVEAAEVYRMANRPIDVALVLAETAHIESNRGRNLLLCKKLHVLAAIQIELHRKQVSESSSSSSSSGSVALQTSMTIETLMTTSSSAYMSSTEGMNMAKKNIRIIDSAWRGSIAFHFYIMAKRYIGLNQFNNAMICATKLLEFDDVISTIDACSIIILSSFLCNKLMICSLALVKLQQSLGNAAGGGGRRMKESDVHDLSRAIFLSRNVDDDDDDDDDVLQVLVGKQASIRLCTLSGDVIKEGLDVCTCACCKQSMLQFHINATTINRRRRACPMCHAKL